MSAAGQSEQTLSAQPRYARFSRRLRGIFVDWAITLLIVFGALVVATSARSDDVSRVLGIVAIIFLVLYEPVLVSRTGGTIGHHLTNLRVVDESHGGNVSFLKAVARLMIKTLLGWYSFILMAATRRNQAIHDLLTDSTVQIRDPAKASPGQFVTERVELADPGMPSPLRRSAVIGIYLLLTLAVAGAAGPVSVRAGVVSAWCSMTGVCSRGELFMSSALGAAFIATCAACIVLGWKARLPGARRA